MQTLTWVLGRGGLLGRNIESATTASTGKTELWQPAQTISWNDPSTASLQIEMEVARFFQRAEQLAVPWRVLWCAGAGVVATSRDELARETALVRRLVADVGRHLASTPSLAPTGTIFFASSAGGVYAASEAPQPFDESSPVRALAPYGDAKLVQEALFTNLFEEHGVDLVIGRFSNLYGPGQNLTKPQGLVAHIGRAALRREPVSVYVPLDTIRDYLYAADAGQMVVAALEYRGRERQAGASPDLIMKIFAAEVGTTVASVLGAWRQVLHRPLRVTLAASPVAQLQPRVLSFRSSVWRHVLGQPTLLTIGIEALRRDQLSRLSAGLG
jgi:UDP-glucose 4-epimerase